MENIKKQAGMQEVEGVYTHIFSSPFEFEGQKYEKIEFNFNNLKGKDVISIESEMAANNEYAIATEISRNFQSKMAARAGKIGSDVMDYMPINDFNKITNFARDFLLQSGF